MQVRNPYAIADVQIPVASSSHSQVGMPSQEWRDTFQTRLKNMRESLSPVVSLGSASEGLVIPKRHDEASWYRFLHGRNLKDEEKSSNGRQNGTEGVAEGATDRDSPASQLDRPDTQLNGHVRPPLTLREPTPALLSRLKTSDILALLELFPSWFSQITMASSPSLPTIRHAVDPFHARWVFALLAKLDGRLVGDEISTLRVLARAGIERVVHERYRRAVKKSLRKQQQPQASDGNDGGEVMMSEMGAWMIVCAVSSIWGQHDLWDDARADLAKIAS